MFQPDQIDVAWLTSARHLHATGVFAALSDNCHATAQRSLELMRAAGRTISFDPNLRPTLWSSQQRMVRGDQCAGRAGRLGAAGAGGRACC